ncbi:hypothetical protein N656DRAFT_558914 [Canariomyces notabilis]|uniref:Uncharacterized protein n=1 Tax=Canariomyces notabilis TaxID=2074819 RepID=A0AAN6QBH8_9PEZI|nr:hypothetical protein N656DRAFT_558914 [Canariomyces arenarius]
MCDYTQREYSCGHFRWIASKWCRDYTITHKRCQPNVTHFEYRAEELCGKSLQSSMHPPSEQLSADLRSSGLQCYPPAQMLNQSPLRYTFLLCYRWKATLTSYVGECKPKEYPPWENLIKRSNKQAY